jgi:hypothetical protein
MKQDTRNYGKFNPRFAEGGEVEDPYGLRKNPVSEGEYDRSIGSMASRVFVKPEPYRIGGGLEGGSNRSSDKKMVISPKTYESQREGVYRHGGPVKKRRPR